MHTLHPQIILASKSPRRSELLKLMGFDFEIITAETDESYPPNLNPDEIVLHIAKNKAKAIQKPNYIVIAADTLVCIDGEILGKPRSHKEAKSMLSKLSNNKHEVYSGVYVTYQDLAYQVVERTEVHCATISEEEMDFYIDQYQPFDKAGSYGIQDWFGLNFVREIRGSYTNVMGLPTERLYHLLAKLVKD